MQQDADFITADFLYMFRVAGGSSLTITITITTCTGGCRVSVLYS